MDHTGGWQSPQLAWQTVEPLSQEGQDKEREADHSLGPARGTRSAREKSKPTAKQAVGSRESWAREINADIVGTQAAFKNTGRRLNTERGETGAGPKP